MLLLTGCAKSITTTIPEDDEWIVVSTLARGWFSDIYGINVDDPQNVIQDMTHKGDQLAWSPDNQWIVYARSKVFSETSNVYLVKSDGTRRTKVAEGDNPVWSPKDNLIAFVSYGEIYLLNVNCVIESKPCDSQPLLLAAGQNPDWSSDGTRITFERGNSIYLINVDTSAIHEVIAPQDGGCLQPDWSPNSERILFRCWGGDYAGFYISNSDGTELTKIETAEAGGVFPKWSPSGERIAFVSYLSINSIEGTHSVIYVMNTDGTDLIRLTPSNDEQIIWFSWLPRHVKPEPCTIFCQ